MLSRPLTTKVFGIALIIAGGVLYGALGGPEDNPAALIGPLIAVAGLFVHFRGRQRAAKAAAGGSRSLKSASGSRVLYLRSFATDPSSPMRILQSGLSTEEEQLARVLRSVGDLVAIGRPGEPLPLPGAVRKYATDAEWQGLVLKMMRESQLVIIRAGGSQGLLWEFSQAFSHVQPRKLLILSLRTSLADYASLATSLEQETGVVFPAIDRNSPWRVVFDYRDTPSKLLPGFICFSDDWKAQFLPIRQPRFLLGYNELVPAFNAALRPVFATQGVPWRALRRIDGHDK